MSIFNEKIVNSKTNLSYILWLIWYKFATKLTTNLNKLKIINDPVYGFISIPYEIIFDLIEHPYFQRLRRIQQLGFTNLVYPGALHTRFHHALGAMHLMTQAIETLKSKGVEITDEEAIGVTIAILLHDIGHGPFSHALERTIIQNIDHEELSLWYMEALNKQFDGQLTTAIAIFKGNYPKQFLHQLVSSQLDMDRLDYLTRDSFFTGVYEGVVGYDRIIKMLNVHHDKLVVDAKGIYSVEKFLIARRLMYWQVYLHKTVLVAELMLIKVLERAIELANQNKSVWATDALNFFLQNRKNLNTQYKPIDILEKFTQLDDHDIYAAIKQWQFNDDSILRELCSRLIDRNLFKTKLQNEAFNDVKVDALNQKIQQQFQVDKAEVHYLLYNSTTKNKAYDIKTDNINILYKNGTIKDVAMASDQLNLARLSDVVVKHYLCWAE